MTCEEAAVLLHALIDGELDAGHARQVEAHTVACARCAAELTAYRALSQSVRSNNLRYTAPASLRSRIDRSIPAAVAGTNRRSLLKGFALGSVMSAVAATGLGVVIVGQVRDDRVLGEAVSAHLRSLQPDRLTDVLSSDQHTVKPWFNGRIDLAPPVFDLTVQGFRLIGGRLDYVDGKPVAAIVYSRRVHVINVFVMPSAGATSSAPRLESFQGFNILRWSDQGLGLLAVSDLNPDELKEFGARFVTAARAARAG
jgi:anti-sigma factor RsiW